MARSIDSTAQRRKLLGEIARLAEIAIFGTLSETYRTCGQASQLRLPTWAIYPLTPRFELSVSKTRNHQGWDSL
jgi:hypothetical protein